MPFELGRPFGAPDAPEFQTRVLREALALLEHEGPTPLLEDFPEDAPGVAATDMTGWTCPISLPPLTDSSTPELLSTIRAEIDGLAPWHQMSVEARGRTATGVLDVTISEIVDFLHGLLSDIPASPKAGVPVGEAFRQASEELKSFYHEAATAKPGTVTSRELADWFWGATAAGKLLLSLHPVTLRCSDPGIAWVAETQLVPRIQKHRLA